MTQLRTRRLGRTGLLVTELGFGAASAADLPEGEETLHLDAFETFWHDGAAALGRGAKP